MQDVLGGLLCRPEEQEKAVDEACFRELEEASKSHPW